ncbi:DUF4296 domain-containing protein [Gracilimonas sp.]|uniref:DUF4296 domain-containing protein n=1 Tax=Gracilimonas sp. TaxID=1974203 RepID=UPI0032EFCB75
MKTPFKQAACFLFLVVTVFGCLGPEETPKPDNLIDEQNYIDLLIEMQHISTYRDARIEDVNADSLKSLIYNKFNITEEQFLATHEYYQKQVDRQIKRVNEAIRQLENEEQYIQAHIDSVKAARRDSTEK